MILTDAQFLTRCAELMARGAEKYDSRNWEKASSSEEMERYKSSAYRHFMQWICGETDEDHASAVFFNLLAYESTKWKLERTDAQRTNDALMYILRGLDE